MHRTMTIFFVVVMLLVPLRLTAQKGGRSSASRSTSSSCSTRSTSSPSHQTSRSTQSPSRSVSKKSTVAQRNGKRRIQRSAAARDEFMRRTGYPKGRKGYVVDHIVPLECGGADAPSNMQWQTVEQAKIKDRTERNCRRE